MNHKAAGWKTLLGEDVEHSSTLEELKKKWKTEKKQLWSLGRHKLYIGDCNTVKPIRILGKTDGICTDQPYDYDPESAANVMEYYSSRAVVMGSDAFVHGLTRHWRLSLCFVYIHDMPRSYRTGNIPLFYHNQIVVITKNEKIKTGWQRPRPNFGSVIYDNRVKRKDRYMSYGKSIHVVQEMLCGFDWKTVTDPFVGYGSTILACENLNKVCNGVELDVGVAAALLQRIQDSGLCTPKLEDI